MLDPMREQKLIRLFAALAAEMVNNGLDHARRTDPDELMRVAELHELGGGHFQLRIDAIEDEVRISQWLLDDAGEPVARVFETSIRISTLSNLPH